MLPIVEEKKLSARAAFEKSVRTQAWVVPELPPPLLPLLDGIEGERWLSIGCSGIETLLALGKEVTALAPHPDALPSSVKGVCAPFPYTDLPDGEWDVVCYFDQIASLPRQLHRLALSELARLLCPEGTLLISTPLDLTTLDPHNHFTALVETEFLIRRKLRRHLRLGRRFERGTKFFLGDRGCTHSTLIAQKKPLF